MRIGLDLTCLPRDGETFTGVSNYAINLTRALVKLNTGHEWVLFVSETSPLPPPLEEGIKGEVIVLPQKRIPFYSAHVESARIMQKAKLDVLHGLANVFPLLVRGGREGGVKKLVLTLHDLAIYRHPEWFPAGQWFSTKVVVPRSIRKADAIIVPSEATAKDLTSLFSTPREKVKVIPHGVGESFFTPSVIPAKAGIQINAGSRLGGRDDNERKHYILFVGTLEPRKNVKGLLEAYRLLPGDIREQYELWIAGSLGIGDWSLGFKKGVKWLGYVPELDLPALYRGAKVFVYPSLYEGFGLPVLEAMAAGVPVVTSRGTAMEEMAGKMSVIPATEPGSSSRSLSRTSLDSRFRGNDNEDIVLIDPYSPKEITQAIEKLIRDDAYLSQISAQAKEVARQFTWERTARETLKIYEDSGLQITNS